MLSGICLHRDGALMALPSTDAACVPFRSQHARCYLEGAHVCREAVPAGLAGEQNRKDLHYCHVDKVVGRGVLIQCSVSSLPPASGVLGAQLGHC